MKKLLLAVLLLAPSVLWAQPFDAFPEWDSDARYPPGVVVRHLSHLWVASQPNQAQAPHEHAHWVRAKLVDVPQWQSDHRYVVGDTVTYKGTHYLARQMARQNPDHPSASQHWVAFEHPAMGYDLPVIDDATADATLLGVDSNQNGIRDDYEVRVMMSYTGYARQVALGVADSFHKMLLADAATISTWTLDESVSLMGSLIDLMDCQEVLRVKTLEFNGLFHLYFNTPERVRADRENQIALGERIGWEYQFPIREAPCESAMVLVEAT